MKGILSVIPHGQFYNFIDQTNTNIDLSIFINDDDQSLAYEISEGNVKKDATIEIKGYDFDAFTSHTLVGCACIFNAVKCFDILSNLGFDVNFDKASHPIHCACIGNSIEILRRLECDRNSCNIKDDDGSTPMHYAAKYGSLDVVKYLFSKGAQFNIKNSYGILN